MTILVTGSTGTVGSAVARALIGEGADVRGLVRDAAKEKLPDGVQPVTGDLTEVDSMRAALKGMRTLFLLNAVVPDEVTQAITALNLAREAGIERIVYFSVLHSDPYTTVPHFTGKYTVERMIERLDLPVSILRPAYFMQNDLMLTDTIQGQGVYAMPVGAIGLAMADVRDIADVAALELIRRDEAADALPRTVINIVGPDRLTGEDLARTWSEVLGRPIAYGGDDTAAYEKQMRAFAPGWLAYDMRMMLEGFQADGMVPEPGDAERLTSMLSRPLRTYRAFAAEVAAGG